MGRVRDSLTLGAVLALGAGCQGPRLWDDNTTAKLPEGVPSAPLSPMVRADGRSIVPASGTAAASPFALPAIPGLTAPADRKVVPTQALVMWRNRVDYLPDHTKNGQASPGLAGQLFLYDSFMRPATPEGKLSVALYDESPRPPGQPGNIPEMWEFDKDTLKNLRTTDERFGACYALFLPWPTYRPDVTKVRLAVRFDPEQGHAVYAEETRITLDTSVTGGGVADLGATFGPVSVSSQMAVQSPLGGPPPAGGLAPAGPMAGPPNGASPPPGYGPPAPPGGAIPLGPGGYGGPTNPAAGAAGPAGPAGPGNLPPIVTIARPLGK